MSSITISKEKIEKHKGVIVLPIKEYQKLMKQTVPTYYLTGKAARKIDRLVTQGLREHSEGKTIRARSLKEALERYGRRRTARG